MYPFVATYVSIHPNPELVKRTGSAVSSHNMGNQTPNVSSHITIKEQVFQMYCKKTSFITLPIPPAEVIFGQDSIFMYQPHEYLDFHDSFLLGLFVSQLKRCLYIELTENFPDFSHVHFTLSF
jgi:hypothetical protein